MTTMRTSRYLALLFAITTLPALAETLSQMDPAEIDWYKDRLTNHVIRADGDGLALHTDADSNIQFTNRASFDAYVNQIFERAEQWSIREHKVQFTTKDNPIHQATQRRTGRPDNANVVRILIHVHGGLNNWSDTVDRMRLVDQIMNADKTGEKTNEYYPIFVSWPSSYFDCYREHLTRLRQGSRGNTTLATLTTPTVLITDLAKGAITMPLFWNYQLANSKNRLLYPSDVTKTNTWLSRTYKMAIYNSQRPEIRSAYNITDGKEGTTIQNLILKRYAVGVLTTPFRMTIGTLGEGQMTASAWQVMKRRTGNLFYPPDLFELGDKQQPAYLRLSNSTPAGVFFDDLIHRVNSHPNYQYQITFVGHSMGTIVLNRLFVAYRDPLLQSGAIENIIYMGAACSVWDALQALPPILEDKRSNGVKFYNLSLHPLAEMSEEMFPEAVPSGSLLYLIDTHLESPLGPLDRTLGAQVNWMSGIEAFTNIASKCYFKGFDFIPHRLPAAHGDFSKCPFWRQDFRDIDHYNLIPPAKSAKLTVGSLKKRKQHETDKNESLPTNTYADNEGWKENAPPDKHREKEFPETVQSPKAKSGPPRR